MWCPNIIGGSNIITDSVELLWQSSYAAGSAAETHSSRESSALGVLSQSVYCTGSTTVDHNDSSSLKLEVLSRSVVWTLLVWLVPAVSNHKESYPPRDCRQKCVWRRWHRRHCHCCCWKQQWLPIPTHFFYSENGTDSTSFYNLCFWCLWVWKNSFHHVFFVFRFKFVVELLTCLCIISQLFYLFLNFINFVFMTVLLR